MVENAKSAAAVADYVVIKMSATDYIIIKMSATDYIIIKMSATDYIIIKMSATDYVIIKMTAPEYLLCLLHDHGNIATEESPKPGLCPTRMTSSDYSAQYHRQHCTLHAFEQFRALYMDSHDDKYPSQPGCEPGTTTQASK